MAEPVRLLAAAAAAALLLGCASPDPLVRSVSSVEVPVPVRERCIKAEEIPEPPQNHIPKTGGMKQKAAGASAEVRDQDRYIRLADELMRRCAAPPKE